MDCPACAKPNRDGAKFCDGCGSVLAPSCSSCAAQLRPGARFCDSCGAPVSAGAATTDVRSRTPDHLVRKILSERRGIEGERRNVTILFADAKGFTPLSEQLDAEEAYGIMQGCVERMLEAVHRYEGTVNQFTGDGIMAIFGAPIAHEDAARRGVAAALDMQAALTDYAAASGVAVSFRVGLNTGPVVVGRIGDDLSMEYTAMGDTTNLAARMEQIADPGGVFFTDSTYRQVSEYFDVEDLGMREIKGKSEPVHVYRAIRERGIRTRLDAAVARGLSPFVGRDREIDVLRGLWEQAREGRGQIVTITGEPGIGKSRMLLEFRRSLGDDVIWREAHCVSYGEGIPYLPVIELVRHGFGITETDDAETIIERIDTDCVEWTPEAQKTIPYLKFLLQVDPGDAAVEQMDPMERRAGVLDALRALIVERSRTAPRVVVVEDLHWADEQSEEAFRVCADVVTSSSVLMILTYRPGYTHPAGELPYAHRIALTDLGGSARAELAAASLEAADLPQHLALPVTEKAEGNPLFIEEVCKAIADGVTDAAAVPNSLQDVILARIDRLERDARESLQLASVIGREFTLRLLNRISDIESELGGVLGQLKALELIYEKAFFPELAYMFKHALTHDVAYSTLLLERRKMLHRTVAVAIEELYPDRIVEHVETLAHHYRQAEVWDKALEHLITSGEKAAESFANRDAVRFYTQALEICERLGDHARAADVLRRRGMVHLSTFAIADAGADLDRMVTEARAAGDEHLIALGLAERGVIELFAHEFDAGIASATEALEVAGQDHDDARFAGNIALAGIYIVTDRADQGLEALAKAYGVVEAAREPILVWLLGEFEVLLPNWKGDYATAIERFRHWVDRLAPHGAVATIPTVWAGGVALGGKGDYDEALRVLADGIAFCERYEAFPDFRARALNTVGWVYGEIEDHRNALEWNGRGLDLAREIPSADPEFENNALLNIADALQATGDLGGAAQHYAEVETIVRNPKPADLWMMWRYSQHLFHSLGQLRLTQNDPEGALSYADQALAGAERSSSSRNVIKLRRLRGQALTALDHLDEAERELDQALRVAREIANPPQLWKTLAARGELERRRGRDGSTYLRQAAETVARVAGRLSETDQRETLLRSPAVRDITADA